MSDRRNFNPVRLDKRAFRQEHVSQALRRAMQQSRDVKWPSVTPAAPAGPGAALPAARPTESAR